MRRPLLTYTQTLVFERLYLLGDSIRDACRILRMTRNALYVAVHRARRRLAAMAGRIDERYLPLLRSPRIRVRAYSLSAADAV